MKIIKDAIVPYKWGDNCLGWRLVSDTRLSVIEEEMPAGTAEKMHYHQHAQQLFYILEGTAIFETSHRMEKISAGEAFYVKPGVSHRIANQTDSVLKFLVISQPTTIHDRWEK